MQPDLYEKLARDIEAMAIAMHGGPQVDYSTGAYVDPSDAWAHLTVYVPPESVSNAHMQIFSDARDLAATEGIDMTVREVF